MQSFGQQCGQQCGQPPGQPLGQPLGKQLRDFIIFMIFAVTRSLSGNMLPWQGFLRTSEELLLMSPESRRYLFEKMAEQRSNLTPRQRRKLLQSGPRGVLYARLLGKQSLRYPQMKIPVHLLRHLMTMGIPRISITPIEQPKKPYIQGWQLTGSVYLHPSSGYICNNGWSQCYASIEAIRTDPRQQLIALIDSDGKVWIGKIDCPKNLFRLNHDPKSKENERATTCAFHPSGRYIAVGVKGYVLIYEISQILQSKLLKKIRFYEDTWGYSTCPPQFSADELEWDSTGTFFTAISSRNSQNLARIFLVNPINFDVKGEMKHSYLFSIANSMAKGYFPPLCSCISPDGNLVATGYEDGAFMLRKIERTVGGFSLNLLKVTNELLPPDHSIKKIVPHRCEPLVFAVETTSRWSTSVHLLKANPDGSVMIIATIPNAKSPYFYKNWLIVSSGNRFLFHQMNSDNIPFLVTEFQAQGPVRSFHVVTTGNDPIKLLYSHMCGGSKLHMAEIMLD